jgi:plasmid maintenance system killer protein
MRVRHKTDILARIEADRNYTAEGTYSKELIRGFRKVMGYIRQATDERDIRNAKSLHYHKLHPPRDSQYALDVSDQFRLIVEWEGVGSDRTFIVVGIEDYH